MTCIYLQISSYELEFLRKRYPISNKGTDSATLNFIPLNSFFYRSSRRSRKSASKTEDKPPIVLEDETSTYRKLRIERSIEKLKKKQAEEAANINNTE